ncbi:MAG: hypothetical protein AAB459_01695 [Patescibacteria group bacterium]
MSYRIVRIHNGENMDSTIIGFSASATYAPDKPAFSQFMISRGYHWEYRDRLAGGVSLRYVEVNPPLSE